MSAACVTGKVMYESAHDAEEALLGAWIRNNYREGSGPRAIYQCHDCGRFHFTSQGEMNDFLREKIESGYVATQKRAREWEDRLR